MPDFSYHTRKRFWTALISAVSVIPLLLISGLILIQYHRSYHEKTTAHLEELVAKHKESIDGFLTAKLSEIRVLARTFSYDELSDEAFLLQRLAILRQEYDPVMVDLGVINEEGTQVAYAGPFRLGRADYSEADWFQEAMQQEYFISDVFRGLRGLPHFIVAVRSSRQGESWILRATIDFVAFNDLVENIRIGETGFAFILNRKAEFQTQPIPDYELDQELYLEFLGSVREGNSEIHTFERPDASGNDTIYVAAPLNNRNWLLVYQQTVADAFSDFSKTVQVSLLIMAVAIVVIVTAAFVMARKMVAYIAEADRKQQVMSQQIVETGKLASVGELAAGIAHEINNPVAIMVEEAGWIEDLLEEAVFEKAENREEFQRALKQIRNQGSRCKQITHKLLSFARKTDTRVQEVHLYDLIEEMVALSAQRAKYQNVEIRTVLERGLPTIHGSISEMQQVMLNLINNALDAMEKGGGTLTLTIRKEAEWILIFVADTGPGIPGANLERIFDPFFTTKPVGKGTGLGLSICYGIITKMGGTIDARSIIDVGTTFRIRLPVKKKTGAKEQAVEAQLYGEQA